MALSAPPLRLEQAWEPGEGHGRLVFRLWNLGPGPVRPERLCYASMTRLGEAARVEGGTLARRFGSHVEVAAPEGLAVAPGEVWTLILSGLTHAPLNRAQGAMAAWIETEGGPVEAAVGDLRPPEATAPPPPPAAPRGEAPPVALLPWPAEIAVETGAPPALHAGEGTPPAAVAAVAALHRRLFPTAPAPLSLDPAPGSRAVRARRDAALPPGGYALDFGEAVRLAHADADGLRHGLVALAQMGHAARTDPRFGMPRAGRIADAPRFAWRGAHLDVARNLHPPATVARLVDLLAWHRMNRLHWHLTDDEGWRLESRAFPALTEVGARRGRGLPLPPQFADGPGGQAGFYTVAEVRALNARAESLGVALVPEIDLPGHATALLLALPHLRDPDEAPESYRSIQGYANNALNPGLPATYEALEAILGEVADLFASPLLHLGGDEVPEGAWGGSPAALRLAEAEGVSGSVALQGLFTRRAQAIVEGLGRRAGFWDEAAEGGAGPGSVLFAWRSAARAAALVAAGHDVVATPGEAYYLDMVDREGWDAAGTAWAGPVSAEATYRFEIGEPEGPGRLLGLQACLWSEHLDTRERLHAMAFPRLSAVAEAAWTPAEAKRWPRFAALAPLMPGL